MIESTAVLWAIEVMQGQVPDEIPDGFQIVPFDRKEDADSSRIIVKAKTGEQLLEGARPFPVTISVDVFANSKWTDQLETIAAAAQACFTDLTNPDLVTAGAGKFDFLDLLGVTSEDPEARKKSRNRSFNVEILATEKRG